MKNFAYLSIDNWQEISKKLYLYSLEHSTIHKNIRFWTWQNKNMILDSIPELDVWLQKENLTPIWMAFVRVEKHLPMHADTIQNDLKFRLRILWPVHACEGSTNTLYDVPLQDRLLTCGMDREIYYEIYNDSSYYDIIETFELSAPIVFNTSVAHSVDLPDNMSEARISFTILCEEPLEKYLY
jgi:hypothetical protein